MGGNFWDGARNGAISAGLNHAMHVGVKLAQENRAAVLQAKATRAFLKDLGYDASKVDKDVTVHREGSIFRAKYARLNNFSSYQKSFDGGQYDSVSDTYDSYLSTSRSVGGLDFSLKYYPSRDHSLGIVLSGSPHYFEAGMEMIDGYVRKYSGQDNLIYDMHGMNARWYLKNK